MPSAAELHQSPPEIFPRLASLPHSEPPSETAGALKRDVLPWEIVGNADEIWNLIDDLRFYHVLP